VVKVGENPEDLKFMTEALSEAVKAFEEGEIPVGAVIVKDGEILARGHNRVESLKDPTAHAEIIAIREATKRVENWRLLDTTMYVTLEPCVMCAGASVLARIKEIVYGVEDEKFGGTVSLYQIPMDGRTNHQVLVRKGPLGEEIKDLMQRFFKKIREGK